MKVYTVRASHLQIRCFHVESREQIVQGNCSKVKFELASVITTPNAVHDWSQNQKMAATASILDGHKYWRQDHFRKRFTLTQESGGKANGLVTHKTQSIPRKVPDDTPSQNHLGRPKMFLGMESVSR